MVSGRNSVVLSYSFIHSPDAVAASAIQLQEVFNNYRQSGDSGSKRRVRQASNAAITGLPDWPSPLS